MHNRFKQLVPLSHCKQG